MNVPEPPAPPTDQGDDYDEVATAARKALRRVGAGSRVGEHKRFHDQFASSPPPERPGTAEGEAAPSEEPPDVKWKELPTTAPHGFQESTVAAFDVSFSVGRQLGAGGFGARAAA